MMSSSTDRSRLLNTAWFTISGFTLGIIWYQSVAANITWPPLLYTGMLLAIAAAGMIAGFIMKQRGELMPTAYLLTAILLLCDANGFNCALISGVWAGSCGKKLKIFHPFILVGFVPAIFICYVFHVHDDFFLACAAVLPILSTAAQAAPPGPAKNGYIIKYAILLLLLCMVPWFGVRTNDNERIFHPEPVQLYAALGMTGAETPQVLICRRPEMGDFAANVLSALPELPPVTLSSPANAVPGREKFDLIIITPGVRLRREVYKKILKHLKDNGAVVLPLKQCVQLPELQWKHLPGSKTFAPLAIASKNGTIKFSPAEVEKKLLRLAPEFLLPGSIEGLLLSYPDQPVVLPENIMTKIPPAKPLKAALILLGVLVVLELAGNRAPDFCILVKIFENGLGFALTAAAAGTFLISHYPHADFLVPTFILLCAGSRFMLKNQVQWGLFIIALAALGVWCIMPSNTTAASVVLIAGGLSFSAEQSKLKEQNNLKENLAVLAALVTGIVCARLLAHSGNSTAPWMIPAGAGILLLWNKLH